MKKLISQITFGVTLFSLCSLQGNALVSLYKRQVQDPNCSHSFKKRLHNYWNTKYNTILDRQQPLSYECTKLLIDLTNFHGSDACQYANWLRTIREPMRIVLGQFDSKEDRETLNQLIRFKVVEGLIQYVRASLLDNLSVIDQAVVYWEKQKSRPFYYFFHKSPLKWFDGRLQDKKIDEHLETLRFHYTDYARKLGVMSTLCDRFTEPDENSDLTSAWLKEILTFFNGLTTVKHLELTGNDQIDDVLKPITHQINGYKERLYTLISHHTIPSRIERSWIDYTVIGAGTAVLAFFAIQNQTKIPGWYQSFKQRLFDMFTTPYKEVKSYFFDTSRIQEDDKIKAEFKEKLSDLNNKGMLKDDKGKSFNLSDEQIEDYVTRFDPTILENCSSKGAKEVVQRAKTAFNQARQAKGESYWGCGTANYWATVTDKFEKDVIDCAADNADLALLYIRVLIRSLVKKLEMAITMGTTVPAITAVGGLSWLTSKLYKTFWPSTDYTPIRNRLIELEHLLNTYDKTDSRAMDSADYGKMIYLIEKLKQAKRLVPSINQVHFWHDIERLESVTLTSEKKCRIIDLMFRQYSFLR